LDDDSPSFDSADTAVGDFLLGGIPRNAGLVGEYRVRIARTAARIRQVRLSPVSVVVAVDGDHAAGSRAELLGHVSQHQLTYVDEDRLAQFSLPDGLPPEAQLVLSREGRWLPDQDANPSEPPPTSTLWVLTASTWSAQPAIALGSPSG